MPGIVSNSGKWKSYANGQVLYGPAGAGQNLNDDLQGNQGNELDAILLETLGDGVVSGLVVAAGIGLAVTITAGAGYCAGQRVKSTAAGGVGSLPASTSGIKIFVEPTTPWNTTNKAWPTNFGFTTGALIAGQVLLATCTTDGSNVTVVTDGRVIIAPSGSSFVKKAGDTMTGALTIDGALAAGYLIFKNSGTAIGRFESSSTSLIVKPGGAGDILLRNSADNTLLAIQNGGQVRLPSGELTFLDASLLGPSIHLDSATLLFRSGTDRYQWNNQANSLELLRLSNAGQMSQISGQVYTGPYSAQTQLGTVTAAALGSVQIVGNKTVDGVVSAIEFINHAVGLAAEPRLGLIQAERLGANNTGFLAFYTSSAGVIAERVRINALGLVPAGDAVQILGASNKRWATLDVSSQISIGTSPASVGAIRLANAAQIVARNAANSADIGVIQVNASNQVVLGTGGFDVVPNVDTTSHLGINALRWASIAVFESVKVGANPAATGAVRLANNTFVIGRNAANGADKRMIGVDSSDRVQVGNGGSDYIRMSGQTRHDIDTGDRLVLPVGTDRWAT